MIIREGVSDSIRLSEAYSICKALVYKGAGQDCVTQQPGRSVRE